MDQEIQQDPVVLEIQHLLSVQVPQVHLSHPADHQGLEDQQNQQHQLGHFLLENQGFHENREDQQDLEDLVHPFLQWTLLDPLGLLDQEDLLPHHCQQYLQHLSHPYHLCHPLDQEFQQSLFLQAYLEDLVGLDHQASH